MPLPAPPQCSWDEKILRDTAEVLALTSLQWGKLGLFGSASPWAWSGVSPRRPPARVGLSSVSLLGNDAWAGAAAFPSSCWIYSSITQGRSCLPGLRSTIKVINGRKSVVAQAGLGAGAGEVGEPWGGAA